MTCLPDDEFGGLAVDDESDIEAKALITNPPLVVGLKKPKKLYVKSSFLSSTPSTDEMQANVKIEPNTTVEPGKSTLKSPRNGAETQIGCSNTFPLVPVEDTQTISFPAPVKLLDPLWKILGILSQRRNSKSSLTKCLVRENTMLKRTHLFGLTKSRPHGWRNGFAKEAMDAVNDLIDNYKEDLESKEPEEHGATTEEEPELTTQEEIAAMINAYLNYQEVQPGKSEYQMHTYFMPGGQKGLFENPLILRTLGLAHLQALNAIGIDEFTSTPNPIGAMILSSHLQSHMNCFRRYNAPWNVSRWAINRIKKRNFQHSRVPSTVTNACETLKLTNPSRSAPRRGLSAPSKTLRMTSGIEFCQARALICPTKKGSQARVQRRRRYPHSPSPRRKTIQSQNLLSLELNLTSHCSFKTRQYCHRIISDVFACARNRFQVSLSSPRSQSCYIKLSPHQFVYKTRNLFIHSLSTTPRHH
ncbi:hypothetical protein F5887DRAFT_978881 [Amanita rubescens]|nr:hypothetical protein F5887DRAFT_978881 [Amanita rubescens]